MTQSKDHDTTELSESLDNLKRKNSRWDDLAGIQVKPGKAATSAEPPTEQPPTPELPATE